MRDHSERDEKERAFVLSMDEMVLRRDYRSVEEAIVNIEKVWPGITTARITKIVKRVLSVLPADDFAEIKGLLSGLIEWARNTSRKLLVLDLECKRVAAMLKMGEYGGVLSHVRRVQKELNRMNDKENQIRLYIYESRAYYQIGDSARARSSLVSARSLEVGTFCPAELQAQIELLGGVLMCDDRKYSTAYSYFIEAVDGFTLARDAIGTVTAVRYAIMSKIIAKCWAEVKKILGGKQVAPFENDDFVRVLVEIAECCESRDLRRYRNLLSSKDSLISEDSFMKKHLTFLYDVLLESNIMKIVEPYSNIKIKSIAESIGLSCEDVERKLRSMIIDHLISGTIDSVHSSLLVYQERQEEDEMEYIEQISILKEFVSSQ